MLPADVDPLLEHLARHLTALLHFYAGAAERGPAAVLPLLQVQDLLPEVLGGVVVRWGASGRSAAQRGQAPETHSAMAVFPVEVSGTEQPGDGDTVSVGDATVRHVHREGLMMTSSGDSVRFPAEVRLAGLGLVLREWRDADIPAMVQLFDEPQVDRWTPLRSPFDQAAARAYLAQARRRRADDQRIQLAITSDGAEPLGEILLFRTGTVGEVELGYAVGAAHRRRGLASRAVSVMVGYAYETLAFTRLLLRISAANLASAAVARRCGFQLTDDEPITRAGGRDPLLTWQHDPSTTP